jgi:hypothetical protein
MKGASPRDLCLRSSLASPREPGSTADYNFIRKPTWYLAKPSSANTNWSV